MTDLSRAIAEEAKTAAARQLEAFWLRAAEAICPPAIRLREIREQIGDTERRLKAALAPLEAEERMIDVQIRVLTQRKRELIQEQFDAARPFDVELEKLYDEENRIDV